MARYPYGRSNTIQRWIYPGSAALAIVIIIALVYAFGSSNEGENQTGPISEGNEITQFPPFVANVQEPTPEPKQPPQPEPTPAPQPQPTPPEVIAENDTAANPEAAEIIDQAFADLRATPARIIDARGKLNIVLGQPMSKKQRNLVKQKLSELANIWLFSPKNFPQDSLCTTYRVRPGDLLAVIGTKFKVPWELLAQINNIPNPKLLAAGRVIKVVNGPFRAKVSRASFTMDVYLRKTFVRSFPVGLARPGKQTPTGLWIVEPGGKMPAPLWTDPDTQRTYHPEEADYPLGSRWIALEGTEGNAVGQTGYGIHGTKEPASIGKASSRGCIRLHNGDAIFVYNLLVPLHSQIRITE